MERLNFPVFLEKLNTLITNYPVFWNFTYSFLNGNFKVLGKIEKDFISKIIQAFSQSLYSHVTFCEFYDGKLYTYGAENLKSVEIKEYPLENKKAIYVIKTFDINEVISYFDKDFYSNTIMYFLGPKCKENFIKRYESFLLYFQANKYKNGISLWDLIQFEIEFEQFNDFLNLKINLQKLQNEVKNIKFTPKSLFNLNKLFFTWGLFKFVVFSYKVKYDLSGVLSILFSPFKKNLFKNNGKLFCSEFVSSAFLYGGFYPFDLLTKSPSMITPGDLMDPSFWIWKKEYEVIDALTGDRYRISSPEDARKIKNLF